MQKKNAKKNKAMRAGAIIVCIALVTMCCLGATLAKYVSQSNAGAGATVAKWGVVVSATGDLYSNAYYTHQDGSMPTSGVTAANEDRVAPWAATTDYHTISVASAKGASKVVAPGTKCDTVKVGAGISGKPEVALTVTASLNTKDFELNEGSYGFMTADAVDSTTFETLNKAGKVYEAEAISGSSAQTFKKTEDTTFNDTKTYYVVDGFAVGSGVVYQPVKYTVEGTPNLTAKDAAAVALTGNIMKDATNIAVQDADNKLTVPPTASGTPAKNASYGVFVDPKTHDCYFVKNSSETENLVINTAEEAKTHGLASEKYSANTDLADPDLSPAVPQVAQVQVSWEWPFSSEDEYGVNADSYDTMLGNMSAAGADGLVKDTKTYLVYMSDASTVTYTTLNCDQGVAQDKDGNVVATYATAFGLGLTATQIN